MKKSLLLSVVVAALMSFGGRTAMASQCFVESRTLCVQFTYSGGATDRHEALFAFYESHSPNFFLDGVNGILGDYSCYDDKFFHVQYGFGSSVIEWYGEAKGEGKRISGHGSSKNSSGNVELLFSFKSVRSGPCP